MVDLRENSFIKYDINAKEFNKLIKDIYEVTSDLRIPYGLIAKDFYKSERQIFTLKSSGGYKDLAKSTKKQKIKKYGKAYPILFASGRLAASLLSPKDSESIFLKGKQSMEIGTRVKYGIYHQSDSARKKIPLRKFLFIDGEGKGFPENKVFQGRSERWTNIMLDYLIDKMERKAK